MTTGDRGQRPMYGKIKKGFISTIIAISLAAILIMLWSSLHQAAIRFEDSITGPRPISYIGYLFDDTFEEIQGIIGPAVLLLEESNATFRIAISDSMPKQNFSAALSAYRDYMETTLAPRMHANLSFNLSNITDGRYELMISRFQYSFNYTNATSNSAMFSGTGIGTYEINISVSKTRANRNAFVNDPAGDINVTLVYSDSSGTVTETRTLNSGALSTSSITYTDNSSISINIGSAGSPGLLEITDNSASPSFAFAASFELNSTTDLSPAYESLLKYIQGGIIRISIIRR